MRILAKRGLGAVAVLGVGLAVLAAPVQISGSDGSVGSWKVFADEAKGSDGILGAQHRSIASNLGRLNDANDAPRSAYGMVAAYEAAAYESLQLAGRAATLEEDMAALEARLAETDLELLDSAITDATKQAEAATAALDAALLQFDEAQAKSDALAAQSAASPDDGALAAAATAAQRAADAAAGVAADAHFAAVEAEAAMERAEDALAHAEEIVGELSEQIEAKNAEIERAEADLEISSLEASEALAAAANKPVDDEMLSAVKNLLGLDPADDPDDYQEGIDYVFE